MKRAGLTDLHRAVRILELAIPGVRRPRTKPVDSPSLRGDLMRIRQWWSPNIAGFGIGRKQFDVRGLELKKLVIRFHVHRKVHESRVPDNRLIPRKIRFESLGFEIATDVRQLDAMPRLHFDLTSGDELGHFTGEAGTVGLFVHRSGDSSPLL